MVLRCPDQARESQTTDTREDDAEVSGRYTVILGMLLEGSRNRCLGQIHLPDKAIADLGNTWPPFIPISGQLGFITLIAQSVHAAEDLKRQLLVDVLAWWMRVEFLNPFFPPC